MGKIVAVCCEIQARRTRDRGKLTTTPSSKLGSTIVGYCALLPASRLKLARDSREDGIRHVKVLLGLAVELVHP